MKRLELIKLDNANSIYESVAINLIELLETHLNQFDNLLRGTSSMDIRKGLINYSNFVESLLRAYPLQKKFSDIFVSHIVRLFFFGDSKHFRQENLDNLYYVKWNNKKFLSPIKPTILHIIIECYSGEISYQELSRFLRLFEYDDGDIIMALNDMLLRQRSLLWSNDGFNVGDLSNSSKIMVAPLGFSYFNKLYGEYFYVEVCFSENKKNMEHSISEVVDFEKKYALSDLQKFINFIKNATDDDVKKLCKSSSNGLIISHWKNFYNGLSGRDYKNATGLVDPNRKIWLEKISRDIRHKKVNNISEIVL